MKYLSVRFIRAVTVLLLACAANCPAGELDLRLIHMNDIHSHISSEQSSLYFNGTKTYVQWGGIPRAVTKIRQLAAEQPNHLILNAGDTFQGTLFYTLFKGDATAAMLNHIPWDAIELGNHEFDDGDAHLAAYIDKVDAPFIAANVVPMAGSVLAGKWTPYIIKEVGGERVGIIGIEVKKKTEESSRPGDEITFLDEVDTAQQYVTELESMGVDKIILLSHFGLEHDMNLASQVSGIDIIIDGDSHTLMGDLSALGLASSHPYPESVSSSTGEPVCIAQAWEYAKTVGSLDVHFDDNGVLTSCSGNASLLLGDTFRQKDASGNKVEVDGATRAEIETIIESMANVDIVEEDNEAVVELQQYQDQVDSLKYQVVGHAAEELNHIRIPGRDYLGNSGVDFPLGSEIAPLVAKSFYDLSLRADACIQNAGGVRINVPEGEITIDTAYSLLPFANTLFEITMTGSEIKQVLEDAISNYYDNGGSTGSFPYAYGLRYDINMAAPVNTRISGLEIKDRQTGSWSSIVPTRMYVIVTNSYIASGKDGYTTFKTVQDERGQGVDTYLDYAMSFVNYAKSLESEGRDMSPLPPEEHCIKSFRSADSSIRLQLLSTYETGIFDQSASEIVSYDPEHQRLFVTNSAENSLDILDISAPADIVRTGRIDLSPYGAGPNSVAVQNGLVAVAVQAEPKQQPGSVIFFTTQGTYLGRVTVGSLPDMLTFTPDGRRILVANEGEPSDDYQVDPEGSISIIDIHRGVQQARVITADFSSFNSQVDELRRRGVRIFGPNASVAQDLEPEYISVSPDSRRAWISLQENNAIALLDLRRGRITDIMPLGYKNHNLPGNGLDASDKDKNINIRTWPNLFGMYQPDALAAFIVNDHYYLVTANEGDSRDYEGFSEESRAGKLELDPQAFPHADLIQKKTALGRLQVTTAMGDADGDGDYDALYSFGARSLSVWRQGRHDLQQVYDSGDLLERITAGVLPDFFNVDNDTNDSMDKRSDNKGPEPEGVAHAIIRTRHFVFAGLERIGGIMVFDVTDPRAPAFIQYVNNRNFTGDTAAGTAGDLGPEGITFIPGSDSPTGAPLLAVANEVSGTVTLFSINMGNLPVPDRGDLNNDGRVDRQDMNILKNYLRQPASVFPECDLDDDGRITIRDARILALLIRAGSNNQ
ncbi:NAD nucleotidase [Thermodesulfobacteriota bacterium B35]